VKLKSDISTERERVSGAPVGRSVAGRGEAPLFDRQRNGNRGKYCEYEYGIMHLEIHQ